MGKYENFTSHILYVKSQHNYVKSIEEVFEKCIKKQGN